MSNKIHSQQNGHMKKQYSNSGKMLIEPKAYEKHPDTPLFGFDNFFIQYGRYHSDETNNWIHILFIPTIGFTMMGLMWTSGIQSFKFNLSNPDVEMGQFGSFSYSGSELIIPLHEVFFLTLGMVYVQCEFVIGFTTFAFLYTLASIMKHFAEEDFNKETGYENIRQIYLYIHLFGWIT